VLMKETGFQQPTVQNQMPICEHPSPERARLFMARDYITGDRFDLVQCRACGLALTSPAPAASEMERYYPAVYYAGTGGKRFPAVVERLQKFLYSQRVRRIERLNGERKGRVLDVGCGPGFLLRQFQKRGWEAQGTELSEQSAVHAREILGLPIHVGDLASARFPDAHFDAVVLWHVLEHVPGPQSTIAEVERILQPGGVFLVGVPNFGSREARLARDKWFHLDVPRHLHHFTVPTLTWILASAGLQVKSESFFAPEYDSFSFVQSALNRFGLHHNLLYQLLRQGRSKVLQEESLFQILATLLLAVPLSVVSFPATFLAALLHQGTAVSLYARKPAGRAH
jgi:SAM-dependent methyltransferase